MMKRTIFAVIIGAAICLAAGVGYAQTTDEATDYKGQGGHDRPMMDDKDMSQEKMRADKRDKGSGWFCPATGRPMMGEREPACPWCGRPMQRMQGQMMGGMMQRSGTMPCGMGMGRGRMHGRMGMMPCGAMGRGMGYGPMHGRMGMEPGMPMGRGSDDRPSDPLSAEDAGRLIETHLRNRGNPNLKLGEVEAKDDHFTATIVTQDDSLVDKLRIDKDTGWFQSIY